MATYTAPTELIQSDRAVEWFYDAEADVLYLSFGEPRAAVGQDIGEGVIVRYDEATGQVVGLTLIGLRARLESRHEE